MGEGDEREVELIEYIEILLKRKRLIIGCTLLCALVTWLSVRSTPTVYEARTLIAVTPVVASARQGTGKGVVGEPGSDIVVPGLSAETYEVLAKGDELLSSLKDSLLKAGLDDEIMAKLSKMKLSTLGGGMLEADLLQETAKAKSPLLAFTAKSAMADLPVPLVNTWAELFVQRNRGLSSDVADDYYRWVQSQYDIAKEQLERTEVQLRTITAVYGGLNVIGSEVEIKTTRFKSALRDYLLTKNKLQAARRELSHLRKRLAAVELDDEWLGYAETKSIEQEGQIAGISAERRGLVTSLLELRNAEEDSLVLAEAQEEMRRHQKSRKLQELLIFEQRDKVRELRGEVVHLDSVLNPMRSGLAKTEHQMTLRKIDLEANRRNRDIEPRVLTVSKAITDESLWDNVTHTGGKVDEGAQRKLSQYWLATEELNPVYLALADTVRRMQIKYDAEEMRSHFFRKEIPRLEIRLLSKRALLDSVEGSEQKLLQRWTRAELDLARRMAQEFSPLASRLERSRAEIRAYEREYAEMRDRFEALTHDEITLASDLKFEQSRFDSWKAQIQDDEEAIESLRLASTRLKRDLSIFQNTYQKFANLVEEARIARQRAAGDIQVVSRAVVVRQVEQTIAQKVVIAGLLGLMGSVILAFLLEYVSRRRSEGPHA